MSDVTYDGVIRTMDSAVDAAEDRGTNARTAHQEAANTADQMNAWMLKYFILFPAGVCNTAATLAVAELVMFATGPTHAWKVGSGIPVA